MNLVIINLTKGESYDRPSYRPTDSRQTDMIVKGAWIQNNNKKM